MNKSAVGGGLAIIAVVLVGIYFFGSSAPEQETNDSNSNTPEITIEDTVSLAGEITFELNTEGSTLEWHGEKIVGNAHDGTIQIKSGSLMLENGEFQKGEFVIDMTTIQEDKDSTAVEKHLSSEDFFDVEEFPEAMLTVTSIDEEGIVTGDLTIKDVTEAISFPAMITHMEEGMVATAEFEINRTVWDIRYDSGSFFDDLGDAAIRDEIQFKLQLVLDRLETEADEDGEENKDEEDEE